MDPLRPRVAVIRQFEAGDAASCCGLIQDCIRQDRLLGPELRRALLESESPETMRRRAASFYLAVYESDGETLGIGGVEMNEIRLLFVSPEHQREGIGRSLLKHLEAMVPAALFNDIFVYSTPAAEPFYRKHGYAERGSHSFDVAGEPLETVFMVKPTLP